MLHALTPHIANIPNVMGSGSALDSGGMIGFVVFWLLTCCFLIIPVPKMRGLIYAKLIVFIISAIAMCAWTLTLAGGAGPVVSQKGTATGSTRAWLIVRFLLLGGMCNFDSVSYFVISRTEWYWVVMSRVQRKIYLPLLTTTCLFSKKHLLTKGQPRIVPLSLLMPLISNDMLRSPVM